MKRSTNPGLVLFLLLLAVVSGSYSCSNIKNPVAVIYTSLGEIQVVIDIENAPITAANFLELCERDVYHVAIFYRTVNDDNQPHNKVKIDVIQGGLFHDTIVNKFKSIPHETTEVSGIRHLNGTISMARNEPGSASTEFFICVGDQPELDFGGARNPDGQGFSAFGSVIKGMDIVRSIHMAENDNQYLQAPILIDSIKILN
ncbi:peptidylprolyl isomerase [Bacteroidota bacterium]